VLTVDFAMEGNDKGNIANLLCKYAWIKSKETSFHGFRQLISGFFRSRSDGLHSFNLGGPLKSTNNNTVSIDIDTTPESSTSSEDTRIVSSKSPMIALSNSLEYNSGLNEVPDATEGEDEEANSPPH